MQETTVGWDPITVCRYPPLYEKLFEICCLLAVGFAIVRSVAVARQLWFGGVLTRKGQQPRVEYEYLYDLCRARLAGLKRLSVFMLLLTFLVLAYGARSILTAIQFEKSVGIAAISGELAELMRLVILGGIVATVFYGFASFYDGVLARRRASWRLHEIQASITSAESRPDA